MHKKVISKSGLQGVGQALEVMNRMASAGDRLFCVDPSSSALGWSLFVCLSDGEWELECSGHLNLSEKKGDGGWLERTDTMVDMLISMVVVIAAKTDNVELCIEQPEIFGSARGSAANNSGSVLKLTALVHSLRSFVRSRAEEWARDGGGKVEVWLVPVSRWKGQTKKEITELRIRRAWSWSGKDHNESDAVGIGDWWLRKAGRAKTIAADKNEE